MYNKNIIKVDYSNLSKYLKDKDPYIFVDKADVIPGESAQGIKNFAHNEWFFACHFPDNPLVPAVFQLEAIMQTAALAIYTMDDSNIDFVYAKKFTQVDVLQPVYPGDQLNMNTQILSYKRGIISATGYAYLIKDGKDIVTCKANFDMIVPNVLTSFSPKIN